MRNRLMIIGLLLLIPTGIQAQDCPNDQVQKILDTAENPGPVSSYYVQKVIERAENGVTYAETFGSSDIPFSDTYFFEQLTQILASVAMLIDTEVDIKEKERSLRSQTACLHLDLMMIEAEIEKVRCKLLEAFENTNLGGIVRLKVLMRFLNNRYAQLLQGAHDPTFADESWHQYRLFDDPTNAWCAIMYADEPRNQTCEFLSAQECFGNGGVAQFDSERACWASVAKLPETPILEEDDKLCPFDTDYLPPTSAGLGCDTSVLENYKDLDPAKAEYEALEALVGARDEFRTEAREMNDLFAALARELGTEEADIPDPEDPASSVHTKEAGCIEEIVGPDWEQNTVILDSGATSWEPRGPFSFEQDEVEIIRRFVEYKAKLGSQREQADQLKYASELESDDPALITNAESNRFNPFTTVARSFMHNWNIHQAVQESTIVAKASDAQLELLGETGLRSNMSQLSTMASTLDEGGRSFTRGLAWFLRRSCIFRPCNEQLEMILKIVLKDECFPYANGEYLEDDEIHTKCKEGL